MDLDAIKRIADSAVAAGAKSVAPVVATIEGSVLQVDGDGLNYSCAGNDETSQQWARTRVLDRIKGLRQATGAERVIVHLTHPASNKRMRYSIATLKEYQGQRRSHRPKNWEFLRGFLQDGHDTFESVSWGDREADDGMSYYATIYPGSFIASEDKDMRMLAGKHVNMQDYSITVVEPDTWEVVGNDKVFGRKWFYLQMLMGDSVDNIPGLPKYLNAKGNLALCGEKTALKLLEPHTSPSTAMLDLISLYRGYWKDQWADAMMEQAALLWLSQDADALQIVPPEFHANPELRAAAHRLWERVCGAN